MADRERVRVESQEGDERWWGEHVEGDTYKSLNNVLSAAPLALPANYDMGPMREKLPGFPGPEENGKSFRVCWGHLLKCRPLRHGGYVVVVEQIVGWEGLPKSTRGGVRTRAAGALPGMTARFMNLTPHAIVIENGPTVPPCGTVARCSTQSVPAGEHAGVPLFRATYGAVEGLPEPEPGTIYIVSGLARAAVPHRADVASPGDLVRDSDGKVIGCKGLVVT